MSSVIPVIASTQNETRPFGGYPIWAMGGNVTSRLAAFVHADWFTIVASTPTQDHLVCCSQSRRVDVVRTRVLP